MVKMTTGNVGAELILDGLIDNFIVSGAMRQGQNSKRPRGRGGSNNSGGGRRNAPPRSQTHDSNGPNIRIRGNAAQVYEKYLVLARDANTAGDRIAAENYLQHADHYFRIFNTDSGGDSQNRGREQGADRDGNAQGPVENAAPIDAASAPQPRIDLNQQSSPQPELNVNGVDVPNADNAAMDGAATDGAEEKPAPRRRGRPPGRPRTTRAKANGDDAAAESETVSPPPAAAEE